MFTALSNQKIEVAQNVLKHNFVFEFLKSDKIIFKTVDFSNFGDHFAVLRLGLDHMCMITF